MDALGTIIANVGIESRANLVTSGELAHVFHLVKSEPDDGDDGEKRGGKIMSEVFLTRLLSTKVCTCVNYELTCTCTCTCLHTHLQ